MRFRASYASGVSHPKPAGRRVVLPRGLNSNRVEQLQVVIKDWAEIYKSPPQLDGKTFQWEPLAI